MHIHFNEDLQNLLNSPNLSIYQIVNQLLKSQIDSFRILRSEFTISSNNKANKLNNTNQNSKSKFSFQGNNSNEKNAKFYEIVNNNTLILRGKTQSGETLFKISIYQYLGQEFKSNLKCTQDGLNDQENMNTEGRETLAMIELINIDNLIKQRDASNLKSFKGKMLASLSHELRTPLNCSMQLIETLYHSGLLQDEDRDLFLAPAIQSNQLLLHIINDILDFCQINNGDLRLIFEEFEIRKAIYECIQLFALQSSQKNLPIEIIIDFQLPLYIRSDQNRFKQVFLNILSNAVKFTEQGKITIEVDYCQVLDLSIENSVKISIQDTGCGITPEIAKNIFNGFNSNNIYENNSLQSLFKPDLHKLSKKNFQDATFNQQNASQSQYDITNKVGAGLGLSISYNLAKGLGSNRGIEFQSQPNVGSIFTFYVTDRKQQVPGCKLNIRSFHDIQFVNWQTLDSASSHKIQTSVILADKSKRMSISHKNSRFSQFQLENYCSQRKISIQYSHQSQIQSENIKTSNQMSKPSLIISDRNIDINQDVIHRKRSKPKEGKEEALQIQSLRRWQQELDKQMYESYQEISKNNYDQESQNIYADEESNNLYSSYQNINQTQGIKTINQFEIQTSGYYLLQNSQIFQQPTKQQYNVQMYQETQNQYKLDTKKGFQMLSVMNNSEQKKINLKKQIPSSKSIPSQNNFELDNQNYRKHLIYSQNQISTECAKTPEPESLKDKIYSNEKINFKQEVQKINSNMSNDEQQIRSNSNSQFSIDFIQDLSPQSIRNKHEISEKKKQQERNEKILIYNNRCNTIYHETTQYKNNIDIIKQKIKELITCSCPSILLVDDNDFNLYALEIRLKPYNIYVDKANNGFLALQKVQARYYSNQCCQNYQLIFMDIDMPVKNGYQAAQEINLFFKSINMKKLSPISACTAFVSEEEKRKAFESGMQYYITKPVDSQKLEDVLLKVFKI
ncbi:ATPase, histidine kinase-, DNA gyrase B (macronuclear) [Tetrahymena thermophila SB210]|uniref:ATPase, histidine kinase-, DNA gyrase B n=1 Tax=Tetrahymena thermophila (strain SB210) TaxID=312017 RepID=I7M4H3_TETTS|nr:ATPase, histidine kinase-, DNA gyrase B [Tetrahymena thermophila SB210]EAS07038.2 ATPase, histidine kinase-, DNA gyrase B [Tetrahymena thermophila SB210]|eukprot:XP_001027280.2 ATPase, histidine kinase-, DNA gyrase B [Tetrahymena thermophila SB210]